MNSLAQAESIKPQPALAEILAPKRRGKRRLVLLVALLTLGGGGIVAYLQLAAAAPVPVKYVTASPSRGSVIKQVTATGTLSPLVTVSVGSQVSGRIKEILVDYNSVVTKGQVIARLDDRSLQASLSKARANVTAARAGLVKARAAAREAKLQYECDRGLAAEKVVSRAEVQSRLAAYQSATAQVTAATANLTQARAALSEAKINVAYATIVSPIDGVVVSRSVDVGQTVSASLQAPTLFLIAEDLRKMEVHTSVAESDVGALTEGMAVRFTVDAHANQAFPGVVKQVRYEAQTVQNVVTYDAVVSVDNAQLQLRPGMTANVTFIIDSREDVLRVPVAALRFRPLKAGKTKQLQTRRAPKRQRARTLWVLRDGKPQPVRIAVGLSDGTNIEVTEGELSPTDKLVTAAVGNESSKLATAPGSKKPAAARGRRPRLF